MKQYQLLSSYCAAKRRSFRLSVLSTFMLMSLAPIATAFERAGWTASIDDTTYNVQAVATIVDAQTIQIDHFSYALGAPAVYFYLGVDDTQTDFVNGQLIGPLLNRDYNDESLTLTLPSGTLEGYNAISVWCVQFSVNFGSASFLPPVTAAVPTLAEWAMMLLGGLLLFIASYCMHQHYRVYTR